MSYDVLVVGEVLVELSADGPLRGSDRLTLSFSGDALNAAAAAAAAGASVGLLARIGDDELGDALTEHVARCGVSTAFLRRVPEPNGMYIVIPDPDSAGGFVYMRRGSAGSTLSPDDVRAVSARALVVSGIGQAISASAAAAVEEAARAVSGAGGIVVYDPNFRARLTTTEAAREAFARIAPWVSVALPSHPVETRALLGATTPAEAVSECLRLGVGAVAVTCGAEGVLVGVPAGSGDAAGCLAPDAAERPGSADVATHFVPAARVDTVVDATGAGDAFAGTLAARLALGAELVDAVGDGVAAAARSLGGRGGTGWVTG